jgi:integrase
MSKTERTDIEVSHRGKCYTLWRRGDNLYLRLKREKRPIWKTLGTSIKELAVKQAKIELDKLERNDWKPEPKKPQATTGFATIGEILDRLEKKASEVGISPRSVADYIHAMERFIVIATKRSDPRGVSSEVLTDELVEKFIKRCRTVPMMAGDRTVKIRPDASIRSHLTQARAIFSKDKMSLYKGLTLPDLTKFKTASPSPKWAQNKLGFTRFDKDRAIGMIQDSERLRLARDPVWVCWAMMHHLAVRNKMVFQAKWSDFTEEAGEIKFTTRGDYREAITIRITVRPELWQQLLEFKSATPIAEDENAAYVVPARHQTARKDLCYKAVNRFFEKHIPTAKGAKKAYQLRGQAASITFKYKGLNAAMRLLGHKHPSTTLNNYAEHLRETEGVDPSDHDSFYGITTPPTPTPTPTPPSHE